MSINFTFEHLRFETISSSFQYQLSGIKKGESRYLKNYARQYPTVRNILKNIYGPGVFSVTMHDSKCQVTCNRDIGNLSPYYLRHAESVDEFKKIISRFSCEAITNTYVDVTELRLLCQSENVNLPKTRTLSSLLNDLGYSSTKRRICAFGKLHVFWYKPSFISQDDAYAKIRNYHKNYF